MNSQERSKSGSRKWRWAFAVLAIAVVGIGVNAVADYRAKQALEDSLARRPLTAPKEAAPNLPKLMATYRDVPPDMIVYSPGRHSGPLRFVLEEAALRIGYAIEWKPASFDKGFGDVVAGKDDILPYVHFKTAEREAVARFSTSMGRVPWAISFVIHEDQKEDLTSFADLNGRTVGMRKSTYYFSEFDNATYLKKIAYGDDRALARAFVDRTVDVLILNNKKSTERALMAIGFTNKSYKYATMKVEQEADRYFLFSRKPERQEIFDKLDKALVDMKKEGVIDQIYESFEAKAPK